MALPKHLASIKRFGARYGRTTKHKYAKIEREHRRLHKCPYCEYIKVKRLVAGIWECRKCKAKFASRAYTIPRKRTAEEAAPTEIVEEIVEEKEEAQAEE